MMADAIVFAECNDLECLGLCFAFEFCLYSTLINSIESQ